MDEKIVDQILDELFSSFEDAETQSGGILLFLKSQGIATEQQLAPFFEQAGNASNVRWRAARVRMGALLASAMKPAADPETTSDISSESPQSTAPAHADQTTENAPEQVYEGSASNGTEQSDGQKKDAGPRESMDKNTGNSKGSIVPGKSAA